MEILFKDLRCTVRALLKSPMLVTALTITLALGIGLNATIFTVVYGILINPLPFEESRHLVMIWRSEPLFGLKHGEVSLPEYLDWRQQSQAFENMAAFREQGVNLAGGGNPERVAGGFITANFFDVLKISPVLGRTFSADNNQLGANGVVLLSVSLWNRRFGADQSVIGRTISLDDKSYTIIGVMPANLKLRGKEAEVWIPVAFDQSNLNRGLRSFKVIGRLASTVDVRQAQSDITLIARHVAQNYGEKNSDIEVTVVPLHEEIVGKTETPLLILFAASGFVLLIACANIVNLLLSRTAAREKEVSIRAALGASRLRIIRQFLTESILLALWGGGLGLLFSSWTLGSLTAMTPTNIPRLEEISMTGWTIVFALLISLLVGITCGLLAAQPVSKPDMNGLLKAESRTVTIGRRGRLRSLLLVSEVALALVLSISAGLLVKSFQRLWHTESGFHSANILTMELPLPAPKYEEAHQQTSFYQQVLEQIALVPGVESVAVATSLPILGVEEYSFGIEGHPSEADVEMLTASRQAVSPEYFRVMGIPLLMGRVFSDKDINGQPKVAIINRTMARRYWGDDDPLGKRMGPASGSPKELWMSIIGVVGDVRESGLDSPPQPEFYVPYFQDASPDGLLVVRTVSNPLYLRTAVEAAILSVDQNQPAASVSTMENILVESVSQRRFIASLISVFAVLAFILASVGVYGVISYSLSQRTREIGIRIALGASPGDILKLALGQSMSHVLLGVGVGLIAAFVSTRLMSTLLYEVSPTDSTTFMAVSLLLVGVSLLASYLPARRAMKMAPSVALRHE